MARVLIKGTQITVPNTVGAGTSFSEATLVRLVNKATGTDYVCLLYTSPSPRD